MEELLKILKMLFVDDLTSLIFISFSWIPIYILVRLHEIALPKILLRLPIFLKTIIWRFRLRNLPANMLLELNLIIRPKPSDSQLRLMGKFLKRLDRKLSWMSEDRSSFPRNLIDSKAYEKEYQCLVKYYLGHLENEFDFLQIWSEDSKKRFQGLHGFSSSPLLTHHKEKKFLMTLLKRGPADLRPNTFSILARLINTLAEFEKVKSNIKDWSSEERKGILNELRETEKRVQHSKA